MSENTYNILLVEDEDSIRKFIKVNLQREKFNVLEAGSGEEGLDKVMAEKVDVVVLDIMLPGIDGFKVCETLRKEYPYIGIIMLTARSQDMDKIMGLEYGADDYMIKPFNPMELVLRIKSLLRRMDKKVTDNGIVENKPFKLDIYSRKLYKNDEEIVLTPTEYSLLKIFIQNPGKAFKRDDLMNMVWGYNFFGDSKIVDVNIRRIRTKIEEDPSQPLYIETVWGTGYRWHINSEV